MIPEKIVFREKEIDKYLHDTKELFIKKAKLEEEEKFIKKNLKNTKDSLNKLHNWYMKQ